LTRLEPSIKTYRLGVERLNAWLARAREAEKAERFEGAPEVLAQRLALLPTLAGALDLISLADKSKTPIGDLAAIFFGLEKRLEIDRLIDSAAQKAQTAKQRDVVAMAGEKLSVHHRRLTAHIAAKKVKGSRQTMEAWTLRNADKLKHYDALLSKTRGPDAEVDLATLLLADERLGEL